MSEKQRIYCNYCFEADHLPNFSVLKNNYNVIICQRRNIMTQNEFLDDIKQIKPHAILLAGHIIIDKISLEAAGPQLKIIGVISVGFDHIDVNACKEAGVLATNTPDVLTAAVAELTIGLLLATARHFGTCFNAVVNGTLELLPPQKFLGKEIYDSTVGIIGLGRIGSAVAKRLKAFDVAEIVYHSRNKSAFAASVGATKIELGALLKKSDIVIVCCSLTDETKGLFGREAFKMMKKNAIFINVTRGAVVQQDDLYDALVSGEIWAAGLDVTTPEPLPTDCPLLKLENCFILPHLGSATVTTRDKMFELAVKNVLAALSGQNILTPLW